MYLYFLPVGESYKSTLALFYLFDRLVEIFKFICKKLNKHYHDEVKLVTKR